ncbi:MAG: hypothetical protein Q8869_00530, partial [Candidatus Phytoplasma australasiaticum]|nr:hypothetical protein [Candidatus Phytoplasma australasiaticum]
MVCIRRHWFSRFAFSINAITEVPQNIFRIIKSPSTKSLHFRIFMSTLVITSSTDCLTNLSQIQRLKSALWYSIGTIIDAISLDQDLNATPQFIGALTELVWSQILTSGADLEAFAKCVLSFLLGPPPPPPPHTPMGMEKHTPPDRESV